MGASFSRSSGCGGHLFHHHHRAGFRRIDHSNAAAATCGMCQLPVHVGTVARQCKEPGCPFLLHDTCYQRPGKLRLRFAHTDHRLTLYVAVDEAADLPCSICAQLISAGAAAYRCNRRSCAVVFRVHQHCCDLPLDIVDSTSGHEHQRLVLRSPSDGTAARRCLRCQRMATAGPTAPWSYQCLICHKEVCLRCLMGNRDGDADDTVRCCCRCNPGAVHCLGQVAGVFLCGLASGMGCPASTAPAPSNWT